MKNQDSVIKIQYDNQNHIIKVGLILCVLIFICIEIGKNSLHKTPLQYHDYESLKSNILKTEQVNEADFDIVRVENSDERINNLLITKISQTTTGIKYNTNIDIPKINLIEEYAKPYKIKNHLFDIESFMINNSNQSKVIISTGVQTINNIEIPTIQLNTTETSPQGMTISQLGNFNVALQVNVRGIGQIQNIEQIGNYNNNTTITKNNILNSSVDNSFYNIGKQTDLTTLLKSIFDKTMDLPISQFSDQLYGIVVAKVEGNENSTYQFQEATDRLLFGRNEAYSSIKGNKNEVAQNQSGFSNTSRVNIYGNENRVVNFQKGDRNYSEILISSGFNNMINITQSGFYNSAFVYQAGANNTVNIIQNQY